LQACRLDTPLRFDDRPVDSEVAADAPEGDVVDRDPSLKWSNSAS
jgi:hypothetical protein